MVLCLTQPPVAEPSGLRLSWAPKALMRYRCRPWQSLVKSFSRHTRLGPRHLGGVPRPRDGPAAVRGCRRVPRHGAPPALAGGLLRRPGPAGAPRCGQRHVVDSDNVLLLRGPGFTPPPGAGKVLPDVGAEHTGIIWGATRDGPGTGPLSQASDRPTRGPARRLLRRCAAWRCGGAPVPAGDRRSGGRRGGGFARAGHGSPSPFSGAHRNKPFRAPIARASTTATRVTLQQLLIPTTRQGVTCHAHV